MHPKIRKLSWYLISFILCLIMACDHGIGPTGVHDSEQNPGSISGTISYINWPPAQELKNLKLIIFKAYPPGDILGEVQSGRAIVHPTELSESLPQFVDSSRYTIDLDPGIYEYVVVAQQYGGLFDWRAVGQYTRIPGDSLPSAVTIISDSVLNNIDIFVDFTNLPIQPF